MKFFILYIGILFAFCDADNTFVSSLQRLALSEKEGSCILPNATDVDKKYVANCDQDYPAQSGQRVPEGIALWFVCNPGYRLLNGSDRFRTICSSGLWLPAIRSCLKQCEKPTMPTSIKYKCYYDNQEIECDGKYFMGTKLRTSCSLPYHHPNHEEVVCNEYGEWNVKNVKCVTDCGIYTVEAERFYKNEYMPWHVLIKRHAFDEITSAVISGTLIAPNLVISESRTFVYENSLPLPVKHFEVVINGFVNDKYKTTFKVRQILLPPGYIEYQKKSASLAIIQLSEKVKINPIIMPICVNWNDMRLPLEQFQSTGKVVEVGDLGVNETVHYEIHVRNLMTDNSEMHCNSTMIKEKLQHDQFCRQNEQGSSLYKNASVKAVVGSTIGGGYYIENLKDHLYYIAGVNIPHYLSNTQNWTDFVVFFTNVTTHIDWINTIYKEIDAIDNNDTVEYHNCGKYSDDAKDFYNGQYLPWHVLIMKSFNTPPYIFSGTLIAPNLVLTCAQTMVIQGRNKLPTKFFNVIVNGFSDDRQQKNYKVKEIYLGPNGFSNALSQTEQFDDIAILHLMENVVISPMVHPICVDWTDTKLPSTFLPFSLQVSRVGGRATLKSARNETRIVNMEFLNLEICKRSTLWTIGYDRFCAKHEGSVLLGPGDFGSGYYVQSRKDNLFYIKGIHVLSTADQGVLVCTDVMTHIEWLNSIYKKVNGKDERNPKPSISATSILNRPLSDYNCENDELSGCYLVSQYNIMVTEVLCAKTNEKCLTQTSSNDITVLSGTKIRYKCKNGYFRNDSTASNIITGNMTTTCQRYRWFPPISQCHPYATTSHRSNIHWKNQTIWTSPVFPSECGKPSNAMLLIWNGDKAKPGEFPWHAAIYESEGEETRRPICGATIISSQYLLSAAHCFVDVGNEAIMSDPSNFQVVVGILKSQLNSKEDYKQYHQVKDIITQPYGGMKYRYQNDMAIIMIKSRIIFNLNVSPICLINNFFPYIPENTELSVAGFGYFDSSRIQSENLMSIKVPFVSYEKCSGNSNYSELSSFLTPEKFCTMRKGGTGRSLDEGDSGGGLVTKGPSNTYYLVGVVSLSVKDSVALLCTYVPHFHRWISDIIIDHSIY